MLHSSWNGIVLQEVPGEISLAISLSGCKLRCKGCHSPETYDPNYGKPLDYHGLDLLLLKHKHISCVCFYGGEWAPQELLKLLETSKLFGHKTCLYTGYELSFIPQALRGQLDFIKTGRYIEALGGLDSPTTNQIFFKKVGTDFIPQ